MFNITISEQYNTTTFTAEGGTNLLDFLQERDINISADCAGNGTCGKCMVKIKDSAGERIVKACEVTIEGDLEVGLAKAAAFADTAEPHDGDDHIFMKREGLGAAVDLGTTTIVISVFDLENGKLIGTTADWNCQTSYGSDVISRIDYCMKKPRGLETLSRKLRRQVRLIIQQIIDEAGGGKLTEVVISGNTVMQHLFAEVSPLSMASAPYEPECYFDEDFEAPRDYPEFDDCILGFCPCIAGFVGGDITSGILTTGMHQKDNMSLLLDIGTNGEMVIGNKNGLTCCSVATGPAFEGAHISCGMRSAEGAIRHISLIGDKEPGLKLDVIGDTAPVGICGTAFFDLLALLLDEGIVDETGRLLGPDEVPDKMRSFITADENDNGIFWIDRERNIYLNAADVRQLQLAKAAVAAGIETLLKNTGVTAGEIEHLYIAGGFGKNLIPENIARIGLIPGELTDKIVGVGNSSLAGAQRLLRDPLGAEEMLTIASKCRHIDLSLDVGFSEEYIEQMNFN